MVKTCCLRTHKINFKRDVEIASINIHNEVSRAINDGYTRFVAGVEGDADMIFAEAVYDMKSTYPEINLEIEIPDPDWLEKIDENLLYQQLFILCDAVSVIRDKKYNNRQSESINNVRYIDL